MVAIRHEKPSDIAAREALLDLAYGAVRLTKPSERLRTGRRPADGLSFVAIEQGAVVGTVEQAKSNTTFGVRPYLTLMPASGFVPRWS